METVLNVLVVSLYIALPAYLIYVGWRWRKLAKKIEQVVEECEEEAE